MNVRYPNSNTTDFGRKSFYCPQIERPLLRAISTGRSRSPGNVDMTGWLRPIQRRLTDDEKSV